MLIFQRSSCSFVIGGRRSENPDANPSTEESRRSPREASAHPSSTGPRVFGRMSTKSPAFQKWPFRILKILERNGKTLTWFANVAERRNWKLFEGLFRIFGFFAIFGIFGVFGIFLPFLRLLFWNFQLFKKKFEAFVEVLRIFQSFSGSFFFCEIFNLLSSD